MCNGICNAGEQVYCCPVTATFKSDGHTNSFAVRLWSCAEVFFALFWSEASSSKDNLRRSGLVNITLWGNITEEEIETYVIRLNWLYNYKICFDVEFLAFLIPICYKVDLYIHIRNARVYFQWYFV